LPEDLWAETPEDAFALPGDEQFRPAEQAEPEGRPRNEKGQFLPTSAPEPEAPEPEAVEDEGPDQGEASEVSEPEAQPDDRVTQYERQLQEKELFIQRQANELGELRRQQEERLAALEQRQQAPQVQDWQSVIDEDPAYAAQLAYDQGNQAALLEVRRQWEELSPGAFRLWGENLQMRQQFAAEIAQLRQHIAPVAERSEEEAVGREMARVMAAYPDLGDHAGRMTEIAQQQGNEHLLAGLQGGSPQSRANVVETLYKLARFEQGDTLRAAAKDIARTTAEDERRARDEAAVVSATRSTPEVRLTEAQRMGLEWDDDKHKDHWNI
jgi:hypothetical protein